MKTRHVIIVGGGASGLMAAITAASEGATVTLIEQKDRVGKKLLSTGNGRCNLTNQYMDFTCFRGDDTAIVPTVLQQFGFDESKRFFEDLGVLLKDRQGYVYPISDQASTILDALRMELQRLQVRILVSQRVTEINRNKKGFIVKTTEKMISGDAIILATGGKAAPVLGSDGSGYALAKQFGHRLSPVVPALVPLKCKGTFFQQIAGIRTQAKVSLFVDDKFVANDTGELQLTNYGISGIPVFQISRYAAKGLYDGRRVFAKLDFIPSMEEKEFSDFLINRLERHGHKSAEDFLIGVFPKKLIAILLKAAQIRSSVSMKACTMEQIKHLADICKDFCVEIEGTNNFEGAQVCAGGVRTSEVCAQTMESVYEKDLYLTGELLDIDGICGGYNLQWAWSTGFIAGKAAAKGN